MFFIFMSSETVAQGYYNALRIGFGFSRPGDVAVDGEENVYIADTDNHRIQVFDKDGVRIRMFGSKGNGDGQFNVPHRLVIDDDLNLYILDKENSRVQVLSSTGAFIRKFGGEGSGDGEFNEPSDIALDNAGNIYIADAGNNRVQVFNNDGTFNRKFGVQGDAEGNFQWPLALTLDANENVFVIDAYRAPNNINTYRTQVFTKAGSFIRTFTVPLFAWAIEVDINGDIYVADGYYGKIITYENATGVFLRSFSVQNAVYGQVMGITLDGKGKIYIADAIHDQIQVFDVTGVHQFNVEKQGEGNADGQFLSPHDIHIDEDKNIYVADNSRIQVFNHKGEFIRKLDIPNNKMAIDGNGIIYVIYGSEVRVYDNQGAFVNSFGSSGTLDGEFNYPEELAIGSNGNIYVVDRQNHRIQIFNNDGVFIGKFGTHGTADGQFKNPSALTIGGDGNVYVADTENSRVQIFDSNGAFIRKFGSYGNDNGQFIYPHGISVNAAGEIYVLQAYDVQVFTNEGVFLTKLSGSYSAATQFQSEGFAIDNEGSIFIADTYYNASVHKFAPRTISVIDDFDDFSMVFNESAELHATTNNYGGIYYSAISFGSTGQVTLSGEGNKTVTPVKAGIVKLRAEVVFTPEFTSTSKDIILTIHKAPQTITFSDIPDMFNTAEPFPVSVSSSSNLPVTLQTTANNIISLSDNTITLTRKLGEVTITASQSGNGNYEPAVPVSKSFHVTLDPVLGIESLSAGKIYISPNPAKDQFTINTESTKMAHMVLLDATGRAVLKQENINHTKHQVSIDSLNPGFYILLIIDENKTTFSSKVLIR
jgi:sugar lactone lactonase YvrE